MKGWAGTDSEVAEAINKISAETLAAYREAPGFVEEHANLERAAIEGGYGTRQLFELVQNGADEMLSEPGRIEVVLTEDALYCANQGRPLSTDGVRALLSSYRSPKRGVEIGRFGLGFKSVLGVSRSPMVFSRSGSVGFMPTESRKRIEQVVGGVDRIPVLRVGNALDPADEARADDTLAALMAWATTVIKLPRDLDTEDLLARQLRTFPGEFLLFAPHVRELMLRDVGKDRARSIRVEGDGEDLKLIEDGKPTEWKVFHTECEPSAVARRDGGAMADREVVPLIWAVPRARKGVGAFWAFFPTSEQTTLSGIVNAPWKLNEDRTRLIDGPFNRELLDHLAQLVWEHAQELSDPKDPGVLLDLMVGRGREKRGDADGHLTDAINEMAKTMPSIPDQNGELEFPMAIELSPAEVPREVLDLWARQPTRPVAWAHPSVDSIERRATAQRYKGTATPAGVGQWLEALLDPDQPEVGSRAAISVAAALVVAAPATRELVTSTAIVLDADGELRPPDDLGLFLPADANVPVETDTALVHPDLLEGKTRTELETLGVRQVDSFRILRARLHNGPVRAWTDADWGLFWSLARESREADVVELLEDLGLSSADLKVRTRSSGWAAIRAVLLPGEIVGESAEDAGSTIDTQYHGRERRLLELVGAVRGPSENGGTFLEPFYRDYEKVAIKSYLKKVASQGKPNTDYLRFRRRPLAGPVTPLTTLSPRSRVAYTEALLNVAGDLSEWTLGHQTQEKWPDIPFRHPVAAAVLQHGILRTSRGARPAKRAVSPALEEFADVLPVARCSPSAARALGLPGNAADLTDEHWDAVLAALEETESDRTIGLGYGLAATVGRPTPANVRCRVGRGHDLRPPDTVVVTEDPELARVLIETDTPHVAVPSVDQAAALRSAWGLLEDRDVVGTEVSGEVAGESIPLGDRFPSLRLRLETGQRGLNLQPTVGLRLERFTDSGRVSSARPVILEGDTLYCDAALDDDQLLTEVSQALGLGMTRADIDAVLRNLEEKQVLALRKSIRQAPDDAARLLEAVGAQEIIKHLPQALIESVEATEGPLEPHALADLALVVHGPDALKVHQAELERRGLAPPSRWAGSSAAVAFAKALGFASEFGGFGSPTLDRKLHVDGPPDLGDLHDYQEIVVDEIRRLLRGEDGLRGLLSLPTGAGKTRVTVEALVQAIVADELESPILWVAQTQELCEQAVQAWREIWAARGPKDSVTINRLWGQFDAEEEAGHQVVVATIAKLSSGIFEKTDYEWLSRAACLVVDEAHQSVGTSYTELLRWQGMGGNKDRAPVIGLTATPFRGVNEEETRRLTRRYGERRLDTPALGTGDAYTRLQDMGILAQVEQETLPGSEIELSDAELDELRRLRQMPDRALQALARDAERNRTLLESIAGLEEDCPVLLFALSVEHAQTMAALLAREGISAASISANTDGQLRRHYVERFRRGDLRVITNFNVLTAGFDAPLVRALYVTRPVYAPNTYQQMIGRGLRGPLNGGTDLCRLVNVADNVAQFGEQLAFTHFDYLWEKGAQEDETVADAASA